MNLILNTRCNNRPVVPVLRWDSENRSLYLPASHKRDLWPWASSCASVVHLDKRDNNVSLVIGAWWGYVHPGLGGVVLPLKKLVAAAAFFLVLNKTCMFPIWGSTQFCGPKWGILLCWKAFCPITIFTASSLQYLGYRRGKWGFELIMGVYPLILTYSNNILLIIKLWKPENYGTKFYSNNTWVALLISKLRS